MMISLAFINVSKWQWAEAGGSSMMIRVSPILLAIFTVFATAAGSQEAGVAEDLQQGHRWAKIICSNCHVASPDQEIEPILRPPAPSFESIAQRDGISADKIQTFLTTTHRDINSGTGMPNPQLLDFQIRQVAVYLMSLRKHK
jgi:mono/diheme cytochrome c family protein